MPKREGKARGTRGAAMLRDFGLTPASRPRVDPAPAPKPANPFDAIEQKRAAKLRKSGGRNR